jgi:phosphinothricin acetyltransferase
MFAKPIGLAPKPPCISIIDTREGIGSSLYGRLLAEPSGKGMHTAIGGIAIPNDTSVLREKIGYSKSSHGNQVGFKIGRWIDVGYRQKMLVSEE